MQRQIHIRFLILRMDEMAVLITFAVHENSCCYAHAQEGEAGRIWSVYARGTFQTGEGAEK